MSDIDFKNTKNYTKIKNIVKKMYYKVFKTTEGYEDVLNDIYLLRENKKYNQQSIKQTFIDVIRQKHNYFQSLSGVNNRKNLFLHWYTVDSINNDLSDNIDHQSLIINKIDFDKHIKTLCHWHKCLFILHYKMGFNLKEIGLMFGFSESRTNQTIKQILIELKTNTYQRKINRIGVTALENEAKIQLEKILQEKTIRIKWPMEQRSNKSVEEKKPAKTKSDIIQSW